MNCPKCNSDHILDGKLIGYGGVVFVEKGTEKKFRPNAYTTECKACLDCGAVFDLHIITTGKRKVGRQDP